MVKKPNMRKSPLKGKTYNQLTAKGNHSPKKQSPKGSSQTDIVKECDVLPKESIHYVRTSKRLGKRSIDHVKELSSSMEILSEEVVETVREAVKISSNIDQSKETKKLSLLSPKKKKKLNGPAIEITITQVSVSEDVVNAIANKGDKPIVLSPSESPTKVVKKSKNAEKKDVKESDKTKGDIIPVTCKTDKDQKSFGEDSPLDTSDKENSNEIVTIDAEVSQKDSTVEKVFLVKDDDLQAFDRVEEEDDSFDQADENGSNDSDYDPNNVAKDTDEEENDTEKDDSLQLSAKKHIIVHKDPKYFEEAGKKGKRFECAICGKLSSARADLLKHIRIHTGDRPYKCDVCDATFTQITALRGHETIHTGAKPFQCDICSKKFALKDRLRLHMRIHTGEKPNKCERCNLTFARRSQLTQHRKSHGTERNYGCNECGSRFAQYNSLKSHILAHRGIKEFQCGECGKKFVRMEGVYKHIRTVHRGTRPYTCNFCGKSFKGHLQQHMRLHLGMRPYECTTCGASFTQNSQLTVHMRVHTGERPYKCQICGAAFAHSSACKIHMRSHTGEKPFQCIICSSNFSQLPHLKKHMKCVHNASKPYLCMECKEFFQTQNELEAHGRDAHGVKKSAAQEAEETAEESTLAKLRNRLAVLLYRISSEQKRCKFGFGTRLIDEVLKSSLESAGHVPIKDDNASRLDELRKNILLLLQWTVPKETLEEYRKNFMTVDEVLDMLTS